MLLVLTSMWMFSTGWYGGLCDDLYFRIFNLHPSLNSHIKPPTLLIDRDFLAAWSRYWRRNWGTMRAWMCCRQDLGSWNVHFEFKCDVVGESGFGEAQRGGWGAGRGQGRRRRRHGRTGERENATSCSQSAEQAVKATRWEFEYTGIGSLSALIIRN